jgi:carboxypeptidase C (cathepsin A)
MKILLVALLFAFVFAAQKDALITSNLPGCGQWDFDAYSGYIPIDARNKFHYVFVESQNKPETDPLLVWFTGGPGCSSMLAFFMEHGP